MVNYLILVSYRLAFYGTITILSFVGFFRLFMNIWIGELAIYLGLNILWLGFFYIWNVLTAEITIDLMNYFYGKMKDEDYYTIPRIIERIKHK